MAPRIFFLKIGSKMVLFQSNLKILEEIHFRFSSPCILPGPLVPPFTSFFSLTLLSLSSFLFSSLLLLFFFPFHFPPPIITPLYPISPPFSLLSFISLLSRARGELTPPCNPCIYAPAVKSI